MTSYHNITKRRAGQYVGFADGAWTITKSCDNAGHVTWSAVHQTAKYIRISKSTLKGVSELLDRINVAYNAGADAFRRGWTINDQAIGSRQYDAWNNGFEGAKKIMDDSGL